MYEIPNNAKIIRRVINLSKESFFHPFEIEFTTMYDAEKHHNFIRDTRNDIPTYFTAGPLLEALLNVIVQEKITSYPYQWSNVNENTMIDEIDFYFMESTSTVEATPYFIRHLNKEGFIDDNVEYEEYNSEQWVFAPLLTKFQLTLEKTSDISSLSFQMLSRYPVNLMSLVSEQDLMGSNAPEVIDLSQVSLSSDGDSVTVLFSKPIYAKRLTFVLGQYNADSNEYLVTE